MTRVSINILIGLFIVDPRFYGRILVKFFLVEKTSSNSPKRTDHCVCRRSHSYFLTSNMSLQKLITKNDQSYAEKLFYLFSKYNLFKVRKSNIGRLALFLSVFEEVFEELLPVNHHCKKQT